MRFTLQPDLPAEAAALSTEQKRLLGELAGLLQDDMDGQMVHDAIYAIKDQVGINPGQAFQAIYQAFLGRDRGPRAGAFLASLDAGWARDRLRAAAGETGA